MTQRITTVQEMKDIVKALKKNNSKSASFLRWEPYMTVI